MTTTERTIKELTRTNRHLETAIKLAVRSMETANIGRFENARAKVQEAIGHLLQVSR